MIIKGHLKSIILKLMSQESDKTGSELAREIEDKLGSKPSYGSIYPILNDLRDKGLVEAEKKGREKRYNLSDKGREAAEKIEERKEELMDSVLQALKAFRTVFEDEEIDPLIESFERRRERGPRFPELLKIHELLLADDLVEKKESVKEILEKTLRDLSEILED